MESVKGEVGVGGGGVGGSNKERICKYEQRSVSSMGHNQTTQEGRPCSHSLEHEGILVCK